MSDFVNQATILQYQDSFGEACIQLRDGYAVVQPDTPETWNFSSALSSIGLGILAPIKAITPAASEDVTKEQFSYLYVSWTDIISRGVTDMTRPGPQAAALLSVYEFAIANKLFCQSLFAVQESRGKELPVNAFLSLTSYILHHAFRSSRASMYGNLNLITLRVITEDNALCKIFCSDELTMSVRLCRQRQPFLPSDQGGRTIACHVLDIAMDAINHNLRRRIDVPLYVSCLNLAHRLLCYMAHARVQLKYHWHFLWQSLLSLIRFLVSYENDLKTANTHVQLLITPLVKLFALSITAGNSFLTLAAYDDLIYKLVETSEVLTRFKTAYESHGSSLTASHPPQTSISPIDILVRVTAHYNELLEAEKSKGRAGKNLLPSQVNKIIRQGYESFELPNLEGDLDAWEPWREGEERGFIKKLARTAVEDVRKLIK